MNRAHTPAPLDRWSEEFDSHWHDRDIAHEKRTAWQGEKSRADAAEAELDALDALAPIIDLGMRRREEMDRDNAKRRGAAK